MGRTGLYAPTAKNLAPVFDLDACCAGYFNAAINNYPPMMGALHILGNHDCHGAMMLGYLVYGACRIPVRKKARISWR